MASASRALSICPNCGYEFQVHDGSTPESVPTAGSVSVCWRCRGLGVFRPDGSIRRPTQEELTRLLGDERLKTLMAQIAQSRTPGEVNRVRWNGAVRRDSGHRPPEAETSNG